MKSIDTFLCTVRWDRSVPGRGGTQADFWTGHFPAKRPVFLRTRPIFEGFAYQAVFSLILEAPEDLQPGSLLSQFTVVEVQKNEIWGFTVLGYYCR